MMLVVSRKPDERIVCKLGELEIEVMLVSIHDGKVRIGIHAPKEVRIERRPARLPVAN